MHTIKQEENALTGRCIAVLGSTGSIGTQTLDVAGHLGIKVAALAAAVNVGLAEEQARRFHPQVVAMADERAARALKTKLADTDIKVLAGRQGVLQAASLPACDTVLNAVMGMNGLYPTMAAIAAGKNVALANKETMVVAGEQVMAAAKQAGVRIIPVDSEHMAVYQCLGATLEAKDVEKVILTASGGPFFGKKREELAGITVEQALKHPNWSMGQKITVDSATLMNKGLEVIEAVRLYNLAPEQVDILVHRESVVHSMVAFRDHTVLAQLSVPDMRLAISYALTLPERLPGQAPALDLAAYGALTFARPDYDTFRCLGLCLHAVKAGGILPAVVNAADEAAVALFLARKIGFLDIAERIEAVMAAYRPEPVESLEQIEAIDREVRARIYESETRSNT